MILNTISLILHISNDLCGVRNISYMQMTLMRDYSLHKKHVSDASLSCYCAIIV